MTTVHSGAGRQFPPNDRVIPYKQENVSPQRPNGSLAMIPTASPNVWDAARRPADSLGRLHPGPTCPLPQQNPPKQNVRLMTSVSEISLHEFNPHVHQIVCHFGHVKPQRGCLPCLELYEKMSTYIPIDPRIQHAAPLHNTRCSVFFKSPVGVISEPANSSSDGLFDETRNPQHGMLHFHACNIRATRTRSREFQKENCTTMVRPSNGPIDQSCSLVKSSVLESHTMHAAPVTQAASTGAVEPAPRSLRGYTRTPSITISMRDPLPNAQFPAGRDITPIPLSEASTSQLPMISDDEAFALLNLDENAPLPKVKTAPKRQKSKGLPMTPIKARKEARIPAWARAESPSKRPVSPSKKQKITPKRMEALEEMVQELRDEFGNLKLHLEKRDQDRDMTDLFFED